MSSAYEVSAAYWADECRRDVDAVMSHYHPDATYEDAGGLRRGYAEIRQAYEESRAAYPGLEVRILREFTYSPDTAGLEYYAVLIDAAGTRFKVRGVNVVTVRDGRFVSVRSYEDPPSPE